MKKLTEKDVEIIVECLPEHMPFEGNVSAIDEETDKINEEWVRNQLENGNEWAWCTVKVTAVWQGFKGVDYLGGCSYKSREDFTYPGGYFDDMKFEAIEDLNRQIEDADKKLEALR